MLKVDQRDIPALFKEVRRHLALSREGFARELGVSFATVKWCTFKPAEMMHAESTSNGRTF